MQKSSKKPFFQKNGEFDWDPDLQSLLQAAFNYGYVVTQLPGGYFAEQFGAKYVFGCSVLIPSIISLFGPILARTNVWLLFTSRLLMGLAQVCTPVYLTYLYML